MRIRPTLLLLLCLFAPAVTAQIHPPAPGVELPEHYLERRRSDREVFTFRRAWFGATERAREVRRLIEIGEGHKVAPGASSKVGGDFYVPVIAGKFSDTGSDPYSPAQLQAQLFDGPNPTGTIPDYYDEISYGALNMIGTVHANGSTLYQVGQTQSYYAAGCNGLCETANTGVYLQELLDLSDVSVDFGLYDNDGPDGMPNSGDDDGFVDFVAFVHPAVGGECGGSGIWSHRWVYEGWAGAPYTTADAAAGGGFIRVNDYTIQPLIACNGTSLIQIGVYAHEFGHAFGLPDLYDIDGGSQGIGQWGLMGSGSYGGDGAHPATPAHMCAWSKEQLGWVEPTIVCEGGSGFSLPDVETTAEVLKVYPHGVQDSEYWLIENRVKTGFDFYLPTSGLAVWHVDNDQPGNADENLKLVDLEEADGLKNLDNQVNRGDAGDLFPGSSNKTIFNGASNPNSNDNANAPTALAMTGVGAGVNPRSFNLTVPECQLRLADITVDDSECANNNGTLDSFERLSLELCLANDFMDAFTGVSGVLSSSSPKVSLLVDTVGFGSVAPGATECGSTRFELEITAALADGEGVPFQLDLSGDGGYTSTANFTLYGGQFILLVEDDGPANNQSYFSSAIAAAGYSSVVHSVELAGVPGAGLLSSALAVVWYTGEAYEGTLSPAEQAQLADYLDAGGRLFLGGQDIGYDLVSEGSASDQDFYAEYLHAEYLNDDSNDDTLDGVAGDPIGDGLALTLNSGADNNTYPSTIEALAGASPVFRYAANDEGAIRWEGAYRLVYFAFNLEAAQTAQRNAVMARILDHLIDGDITPPTLTLTAPTGGEIFDSCTQTTIAWNASDDVQVEAVELFVSADAGASWSSLILLNGNPGSYAWNLGAISGNHRIKAIARDAADLQGVAISGDFSVSDSTAPSVTLASPNGGEVFAAGSNQNIAWSSADDCSGVLSTEIWLSLDDGGNWSLIDTVFPPSTSSSWLVPATPSTQCRIRVDVEDVAGNVGSDSSDLVFEIAVATEIHAEVSSAAALPVSLFSFPDGNGIALTDAFQWDGVPGSTPVQVDATIQIILRDGLGNPIVGFPADKVSVQSSSGGWVQCADEQLHADAASDVAGAMTISGALFGGGFSGPGELLELTIDDPNLASISYDGGGAGLDIRVNSVDMNKDGIANLIDVGNLAMDLNNGYAYRSDFSWNQVLNIADVGRFAMGLQTACPPAAVAPPQLAGHDDQLGVYFDLAGAQRAIAAESGRIVTAHLLLSGSAARRGIKAWETTLELSDNLELVERELPSASIDLGDAQRWTVGTGETVQIGKSARPLLLATLHLRVLDDAPAQIALSGVSGQLPAIVDAQDGLFAVRPSSRAAGQPVAYLNDRSVTSDGRFAGYALGNHPNPFNPATSIQFNLPQSGHARVRIHDVAGRLVRELDAGRLGAGAQRIEWDGLDRRNAAVTSGVYFARLYVDGELAGHPIKMSLLK